MEKGIELEHVGKTFDDGTVAVSDICFSVDEGEFFILLGPSGCGKSTILNLIVGLESVSEGTIRVGGKKVNHLDPKDRNMAMVFQSYALYPHLTVRRNMEFPLKLAGMAKEQIAQRVEQAAAILELNGLLDRLPRALSGGQRQRVAMGRAIVRQPRAFLLDEPLSNLDARLRVQMRAEIAALQKKLGTTMIYVTHDQTEAMTLGDRLALLRGGKVQQIGSPRDLYEAPHNLFVAGFIGSPAMNFLPAVRLDDYLQLPMLRIPLDGLHTMDDIPATCIVGLRPEHILPSNDGGGEGAFFRGRAAIIEWLGADGYVHMEISGEDGNRMPGLPEGLQRISAEGRILLTARFDPARRIVAGEELAFVIDTDKLHFFDPASGARLG